MWTRRHRRARRRCGLPGILVEASEHADLMLLGSHRPILGLGPALGRVSHAVLHHGQCPVEIVPPAYVGTGERD
ncbi:universal stress protein [Streptomyces sp. NPDC058869]|uniref:universal stress protein n=1 Tax=Streptomyces sp. NPDC058869 TaxID=3346659 RepID=UPI003695DAAE